MAGGQKSKKTHKKAIAKKRHFTVEGSEQKTSVLAERMNQQTLTASTPLPLSTTQTNLPYVPMTGNFPNSSFYWISPPTDDGGIENHMILAINIMRILNMSDCDLHMEMVLALYLNLVACIFPQSKMSIQPILEDYHFTILKATWDETLEMLAIDPEDLETEVDDEAKQTVVFAAAGIYLCLIGKQLTSQNYNNWIKSRVRSFTSSCAVENNNPLIPYLTPSTVNSVAIYGSVSSRWDIRREIFLYIRASANAKGTQAAMASSCMVLLHGAELGNFSLTNKYILIENPILLCWQELAKHAPVLIAAVDKYQSLGEDAPYCKLLYPARELQEFTQYGLKIFAAIARQIAVQEGMDSLQNYAGAETSANLSLLISKAMYLVKVAGGANTFTTKGVRDSFLVKGEENSAIHRDLGFGAHVARHDQDSDLDSDDSEEENVAT